MEIIVNPWDNDLIFNYDDVSFTDREHFGDKKIYFDDMLVAQLLLARKLHLNDLPTQRGDRTVCFYVACSDTFAWGSADSESVAWGEEEPSELTDLYEEWYKSHEWGCIRWVIKKRGIMPMKGVKDQMEAAGAWGDMPELLPNPYEQHVFSKKDSMYNKIVLGYQEEDIA